jgi:hypothetical protein
VGCGLQLDDEWLRAHPDGFEQLLACLDRAFRPAVLLGLEAIHVHRQFCRGHDIFQKHELPPLHLRPIAQVEVFREGVMLPSASVFDARFAPDPGGSVEIEEPSAAAAGSLLNDQVPIQKHGLNAGEQ